MLSRPQQREAVPALEHGRYPRERERWWSTQRGHYPGVVRCGRKFKARVSVKGHWVYLGIFPTEFEAARAAKAARERKKSGKPILPSARKGP